MTSPSRRRARQAAVIAVAAVAVAGVTATAIRATRRRTGAVPEPPAPSGTTRPPALHRRDRGLGGVPPRARRNWAALIAVPAVAVVAGTVALVAARPPANSEAAPMVLSVPPVLSVSSVSSVPARAEPDCQDPAAWTPPPNPSASVGSASSVVDVGFPPCRVAVLGETVILSGLGELIEVTATRALDPRVEPTQQPGPDGTRRVSFRIHFASLGADLSALGLRPVSWAASEQTGWVYPVVAPVEPIRFAPGGETDQFVAYDVGENVRLSRLRVSVDSSTNQGIAEWVIG